MLASQSQSPFFPRVSRRTSFFANQIEFTAVGRAIDFEADMRAAHRVTNLVRCRWQGCWLVNRIVTAWFVGSPLGSNTLVNQM